MTQVGFTPARPGSRRWSSGVLVVLLALSGACVEDSGGAGTGGTGSGGAGGGGAGGDATAGSGGAGGHGTTAGPGGGDDGDDERARIDAERATLDACGLPDVCPELHQSFNNDAPMEARECPWAALAVEDASARFTWRSTPDGCFDAPCEDVLGFLYVSGGKAALSWARGPLQRCAIRDPAFFRSCADAFAEGESVPVECRFFDGWVEDCVDDVDPVCL